MEQEHSSAPVPAAAVTRLESVLSAMSQDSDLESMSHQEWLAACRRQREQLDREANAWVAKQWKDRNREALNRQARIPTRYANMSLFAMPKAFATLPQHDIEAWQAVAMQLRELATSGAPWLLHGPRGNGKTGLACAAIRMFIDKGRTAWYATARTYVTERRATWGAKNNSEDAVLQRWVAADLIVLDEYHEKQPDPRSDGDLVELIDARYAEMRPTLLVTNLTEAGFAEMAGSSISNRLKDDGQIIHCAWAALRGRLVLDR